jgi:hypothetical protein
MSEIELTKLKLGELVEYSNNAKLHPTEQVMKIMDSIIAFGYNDPIAVDEKNQIIEGHGRIAALHKIISDKNKEITVIRITGLNKEQKIAYRIAHNKINLDTSFDLDKLSKDFNLLEDTDYFNLTGFSTKEISEIWDKKEPTSELVEQEKMSKIEHTCPSCGHVWEEEIKKSRKNG